MINNAGYRVLNEVDLEGKQVLEVGPGGLYHQPYWNGKPDFYSLVDLDKKFLADASAKLSLQGVSHDLRLTDRNARGTLPAADSEFDIIVTFYSLEHLYPFTQHMKDMLRVLKPGGRIVGAIPAEGGLAWGLGRYFTSRRWLKKNTRIDPDKIICWEHPSMADEILSTLSENLDLINLTYWPSLLPSIDLNLILKFIFQKRV
jgi:SAM-dependent methyltransferase